MTKLNDEQRAALRRTRTAVRIAMFAAVTALVAGVVGILIGAVLPGLCLLVPGIAGIWVASRALAGIGTRYRSDGDDTHAQYWGWTGGGWDV